MQATRQERSLMNHSGDRQAKLPEDLERNTIDSMTTGDVGYTLPWGMWVDTDRNCWLHPKYPIDESPHGTAQMRVALHENGYHVWAPPGETWDPQAEPGYMSPQNTQYIPVVELHR